MSGEPQPAEPAPGRLPDLSVLVVSYQTRELTLACLAAVEAARGALALETIVVDNASGDGSADAIAARFPDVRLERSPRNLGFAAATNRAAELARGEHLLLLNPDTRVALGALERALAFARARPEVGAVGGRTLFADGTLNPSSCWGRPTPWSLFCHAVGLTVLFRGNRLLDPESLGSWRRDSARPVDIVSGCFLLISRSLWRSLGGFDEAFFMYGEDADLCLRLRAAGRACWITPEAELVHHGGASERVRADKMVRLFRAKAQLFAKHWSPARARFGGRMLSLWALTRSLAFGSLAVLWPARAHAAESWRAIWARRAEWTAVLPRGRARA